MENNIGYYIQEDHFRIEEVNFEQLKQYTNNVIIEYTPYFKNFRRALFELDRLGFNIGIYANKYKDVFFNSRGFNIKLGIYLREEDYRYNYTKFQGYKYIIGIVSEDNSIAYNCPRWGHMGDIENLNMIELDFIRGPIQTLKLNTDFIKIYNENNLFPISSTFK